MLGKYDAVKKYTLGDYNVLNRVQILGSTRKSQLCLARKPLLLVLATPLSQTTQRATVAAKGHLHNGGRSLS